MALFESKTQRDFKRRLKIKKGINKLKKLKTNFDKNIENSITKARELKERGDLEMYKAYRTKIKREIIYRDFLDKYITKIELLYSDIEFKRVTQESLRDIIGSMSKIIKSTFREKDIGKTIKDLDTIGTKGNDAFFVIETMMEDVNEIISDGNANFNIDEISDDTIDKMIGEVSEKEETIDMEELEKIKKSIGD